MSQRGDKQIATMLRKGATGDVSKGASSCGKMAYKDEALLAKNEKRKESMSYRDDEDAGRLRWLSGESTYQIMWTDENGKDVHRDGTEPQ